MTNGLQIFNAAGVQVFGPTDGIGRVTGYIDLDGYTVDPDTGEYYFNDGSFTIDGYVAGDTAWYTPIVSDGGTPAGAGFNINTYSLSGNTVTYHLFFPARVYFGLY